MTTTQQAAVTQATSPGSAITQCICCGSNRIQLSRVLWPSLIEEWGLSAQEAAYIDRQQGLICEDCGASLRAMVLARAIMSCWNYRGLFKRFSRRLFHRIDVLEINEAANLTKFLRGMGRHVLAGYPAVDAMKLPYHDASFDLVVHSDTLEHIPEPLLALAECRRVLRPGGFCVYTVPIIVGRLTVSRAGKPPSFHGGEKDRKEDFIVCTEYGADAWTHPIQAGFAECRIVSLDYPAAQALIAVKNR
jgi:SAM-dependent methyltransferase